MSKIHTQQQLQSRLDDEYGWRLKEIHLLKRIAGRQDAENQSACIRANIVMLYAHWEGFIKACAEAYLQYVTAQRTLMRDLTDNFIALALRSKLRLFETRSMHDDCRAVGAILSSLSERAHVPTGDQIKTRSNLKFEVFNEICTVVGIDSSPYATRERLIDVSLVGARNEVAHGKYLSKNLEDYASLCSETLDLMQMFKTDVLNAAATGGFRRPSTNSSDGG